MNPFRAFIFTHFVDFVLGNSETLTRAYELLDIYKPLTDEERAIKAFGDIHDACRDFNEHTHAQANLVDLDGMFYNGKAFSYRTLTLIDLESTDAIVFNKHFADAELYTELEAVANGGDVDFDVDQMFFKYVDDPVEEIQAGENFENYLVLASYDPKYYLATMPKQMGEYRESNMFVVETTLPYTTATARAITEAVMGLTEFDESHDGYWYDGYLALPTELEEVSEQEFYSLQRHFTTFRTEEFLPQFKKIMTAND